jgi:hypothetical protein
MNRPISPGLLGILAIAASLGPAPASWPAAPRRHEPTPECKEIQDAAERKRARKQQRNLALANKVQRGPGVA